MAFLWGQIIRSRGHFYSIAMDNFYFKCVFDCLSLRICPFLCFQAVTASPEQDVCVWLAVHEDGLSVLEHSSVVRIVRLKHTF